jgi:hypothetical protein
LTAESLSLTAGTLLSLVFSYVPGAKGWFMQFDPQVKRLIMLGLIIMTACIVFGLACLEWAAEFGISVSCSQSGLFGLVRQAVLAIIANQGIYAISPHRKPNRVGGSALHDTGDEGSQ